MSICNDIVVGRYIGAGSYGEVYSISLHGKEYAMKAISPGLGAMNEIEVMEALKGLIDAGITDNFTYIYDWDRCDNLVGEGYEVIIIMNKADKDLYALMQRSIDTEVIRCIVFQLIYGLLCGIAYLKLDMGDIRPQNVLVANTDTSRSYIIDGVTYSMPSHMPLIMYSDFGLSFLDTDTSHDVGDMYNIIWTMCSQMNKKCKDDNYKTLMKKMGDIGSRTPTTISEMKGLFKLPYFDVMRHHIDGSMVYHFD